MLATKPDEMTPVFKSFDSCGSRFAWLVSSPSFVDRQQEFEGASRDWEAVSFSYLIPAPRLYLQAALKTGVVRLG